MFLFLLAIYLEVEFLNYMVTHYLTFGALLVVFQSGYPTVHYYHQSIRDLISLHPQHLPIASFDYSYPSGCEMVSLYVVNFSVCFKVRPSLYIVLRNKCKCSIPFYSHFHEANTLNS